MGLKLSRSRKRRTRNDRGAIAVLSALLAVVFLLLAAFAVDIASQVNNKHFLQNQLDAAVTGAAIYADQKYDSAAGKLPLQAAVDEAVARFNDNAQRFGSSRRWDASLFSHLTFWCVAREDGDKSGTQASLESLKKNCNPDYSAADTPSPTANPTYGFDQYQNLQRPAISVGGASVVIDKQSMSCDTIHGSTLCAVPCAMTVTASGTWNSDHTAVSWSPGSWDAGHGGMLLSDGTTRGPIACNAVQLADTRLVNFQFSGAGAAIDSGTTVNQGHVGGLSVACKGWCGLEPDDAIDIEYVPSSTNSTEFVAHCTKVIDGVQTEVACPEMFNAQDIAVVGDRTLSMSDASLSNLMTGVHNMVTNLDQNRQYVALGTIGKSKGNSTCPSYRADTDTASGGTWMATGYSKTYLNANDSAKLLKAIDCMNTPGKTQGTELTAPFKAAARSLLYDANAPRSSGRIADSSVQKVLIFETDGTPQNANPVSTVKDAAADLSLTSATDPYSVEARTDGTNNTGGRSATTYRYYCAATNAWVYTGSTATDPTTTCATGSAATTQTYYYCNVTDSPNYGEVATTLPTSGCLTTTDTTTYKCSSANGGADGGPTYSDQVQSDYGAILTAAQWGAKSSTQKEAWCLRKDTQTGSGAGFTGTEAWVTGAGANASTKYCSRPSTTGGPSNGGQLTVAGHYTGSYTSTNWTNATNTTKNAWCKWKDTQTSYDGVQAWTSVPSNTQTSTWSTKVVDYSTQTTYVCAVDRDSLYSGDRDDWMATLTSTPNSWCRNSSQARTPVYVTLTAPSGTITAKGWAKFTDTVTTTTYNGGQKECSDLQNVATQAKAAGITVITVAFALNGTERCSLNNTASEATSLTGSKSGIDPDTASYNCVGHHQSNYPDSAGSFGPTSLYPYFATSTCTYPGNVTGSVVTNDTDDPTILSVLNSLASPPATPGTVDGCGSGLVTDPTNPSGPKIPEYQAENLDGDSFYCLTSSSTSTQVTQALLQALVNVSPPDIVRLMTKP